MTHESTTGGLGGLSRVSRRTVMSALASATLVAPSIVPAAAETAPVCSFPDLATRFVRARDRNSAQLERDKMRLDDHLVDKYGASIPWTEINEELNTVEHQLLVRTPQSIIDLAWQAEAVWTTDVEPEMFDREPTAILTKLIEHIRVLAGPLPIPEAAAVFVPAPRPDPILAALEAHKQAVAAYNGKIHEQDALEAAIPSEKRQSNSAGEIVETDDPRWIKFQKDVDRLADAEMKAECELANVAPMSIAGVIALLDYAVEVERELGFREIYHDPDEPNQKRGRSWYYFVNRNLADYLRTINGRA
jgi:hypothetical protein